MEQKMLGNTADRLAQRYAIPIAILIVVLLIGGIVYRSAKTSVRMQRDFVGTVTPSDGVALPVTWGDLGKQLISSGVVDREKFVALYGSLTNEQKTLLDGSESGELRVTAENAPYLLNLLWALGLGNSNQVLKSEMTDSRYGGAGGFASTGGWTVARGNSMDHFSKHVFISLTLAQQKLVDEVSQNIYRPCCDNSTHFPDCNHGMATLGLLELMASQGRTEDEMYWAALVMNSYWFSQEYRTIAAYFASKGTAWKDVSPKEVLRKEYSSASGYARVAALMQPKESGGLSCSV